MKAKRTLILAVFLVALLSTSAAALRISIGGFGGSNLPIAQEDVKPGYVCGGKARVVLLPVIAVEPNFTYLKNGDCEIEVEYFGWSGMMYRDGGKFTSFGIDIAVGGVEGWKGLSVYGIGGLSSAKYERSGIPELTQLSWWLGIGLEYSITDHFSIDLRGKALIFPYDGGNEKSSRKNGLVTLGANFYFGKEGY